MPADPYGASNNNASPKWQFYPTRLGRDIYNRRSITGLARSTTQDLINYVTSGIRHDGILPLNPRQIAEALIVDGPVVIGPGGWWQDCYCPDERTIIQYTRNERHVLHLRMVDTNQDMVYTQRLRVWELIDGMWNERLYEDYYGARKTLTPEATETALQQYSPADFEVVYPNGRGLIYWAQHAFNRIDEIAVTMRNVGSGINLLPIISGETGSADDARNAIAAAINAIIFPGDVRVDRVVSEAIVNQLVRESELARNDAISALNAVEQDTPDRPVAADRELRSRAMLEFVNNTRSQLAEIYASLPSPVEVTFDPFIVRSADERQKDMQMYAQAASAGHLDPVEYETLNRAALGLTPRRASITQRSP